MLDVGIILKDAFDFIYKYEEVEVVDSIPGVDKSSYIQIWKISTEIELGGSLFPVVLFCGFYPAFPYQLPDVFASYSERKTIPHCEHNNGKLCILEDNVWFNPLNYANLLKLLIQRAKTIIAEGLREANVDDFKSEVESYWNRNYHAGDLIEQSWIFYNDIPEDSCVVNTIEYKDTYHGSAHYLHKGIIYANDSDKEEILYSISKGESISFGTALYINSFALEYKPPFRYTFNKLLDASSSDDKKLIRQFVNKNNGGLILFRLTDNRFGGFVVKHVSNHKKGFRINKICACDILEKYERRATLLPRIHCYIYSNFRIQKRTEGIVRMGKKFIVAGLGSVGSNLLYFLSGWNNSELWLIDNDQFSVDNIGRHLLGLNYVNQAKVFACEHYLRQSRPDRQIKTSVDDIESTIPMHIDEVNKYDAMFLCTGNTMSESYIIQLCKDRKIEIPLFVIWLEPFAISAHMIYINPQAFPDHDYKLFDESSGLYRNNLIADSEYLDPNNSFTERDAGCNGSYALYSGNDVILMLSSFYKMINELIEVPQPSTCYRWIGNLNIAKERGIILKTDCAQLLVGNVEIFKM